MGIRFKQAEQEARDKHHLEAGASVVESVYPDSPAEAAGVQVGDIILGPPGAPFKENQQIREWTMLSKIDEPKPLVVLRGDHEVRLTLAPKAYPLQWTTVAGPPKVDAPAPAVTLTAYNLYRVDARVEWKTGAGVDRQVALSTLLLAQAK